MAHILYRPVLGPLNRVRCQSGPLAQFALGRFPDEGDVGPFRDVIHHKYSIKMQKQHVILFKIERRTRWQLFHLDTVRVFEMWTCNLKKTVKFVNF